VTEKKINKKTVAALKGNRGPRGFTGAQGAPGAKGAQGPQGPGGKIVTYDATPSDSETITTLGTFLGDTIGALCDTVEGEAELEVYVLQTSDGSWNADYGEVFGADGDVFSDAGTFRYPAGALNHFMVASIHANEGNDQWDFVQLGPSPGSMIWHLQVSTASGTCHLSVQSIPETITAASG
jgi:hypothetical protein